MKTFYVGIKGVIVKEGKVLLLRANKAQDRRDIWEMPGGRIDDNETIEQTLRRELKEELPNIKDIQGTKRWMPTGCIGILRATKAWF